ncbi:hypothetical protein FIA58_001375 [Flavobacterium jejuense]|uniref:Uncharacterized protein n=1 Tax=Flavobacterium jejuense TaxID=1544455 RepID=A0ABX0IQB3_9FLAO|nr:hypothetical protein [Flavobacterium jejuense]NHN24311.1 hypothetical protein [Flavobacterium jejuense]
MKLFLSFFLFSSFLFSQNKELKLYESKEECQEPIGSTDGINQRIISSKIVNDTLSMEIQYIENCGNGAIISYSILQDTILFNFNRDFKNNELADCNCVFINKLKFLNPKIKKPIIKINPFVGKSELKPSDSYYLPEKYSIRENDSLVIYDGKGYNYSRTYYDSGKIHVLWIRKFNFQQRIIYYENGMIKSIRQLISDFDHYILQEFDITGKLIKYENTLDLHSLNPTEEQRNKGASAVITTDSGIKYKKTK